MADVGVVFINGKFLAQETTGVQRVARSIVGALDRRLAAAAAVAAADGTGLSAALRWVLLVPPGAKVPALIAVEVRVVGRAFAASLHAWEQVALPRAAFHGVLVNLAGSAPAAARCQVCVLHDAAVFDFPRTYTPIFVAWYRWLFRRLARRAAALVTVSMFSRSRLAATLGIDASRIFVVHNGGDHLDMVSPDHSFLGQHDLEGKRFVLAVGSDSPNKNFAAIARALGDAGLGEDVALVIAGSDRGAVFAEVASNEAVAAGPTSPIQPAIVRVGRVGDEQLVALYDAASAFVLASRYEGFGLPPLEAMSRGCPVVATTAGAVPEICGNAVVYADPDSPGQLATAIRRVFDDAALRADLAARGKARVAVFTWDAAAARLQAVVAAHRR